LKIVLRCVLSFGLLRGLFLIFGWGERVFFIFSIYVFIPYAIGVYVLQHVKGVVKMVIP